MIYPLESMVLSSEKEFHCESKEFCPLFACKMIRLDVMLAENYHKPVFGGL